MITEAGPFSITARTTIALVSAIVVATGAKHFVNVGATIIGAAALIHLGTLDAVNHGPTPRSITPIPAAHSSPIAPALPIAAAYPLAID